MKLYKTNVIEALRRIQSSGDACEWQNDFFKYITIQVFANAMHHIGPQFITTFNNFLRGRR